MHVICGTYSWLGVIQAEAGLQVQCQVICPKVAVRFCVRPWDGAQGCGALNLGGAASACVELAPPACLYDVVDCGVILKSCGVLCHAVLLQEGEAFATAASLDTHKALVHIFFATRSTKKVSPSVL